MKGLLSGMCGEIDPHKEEGGEEGVAGKAAGTAEAGKKERAEGSNGRLRGREGDGGGEENRLFTGKNERFHRV